MCEAEVPDFVVEALASAVTQASRPIVLIDGRSGAGKTMLAARLAPLLGAEVVHLDDIYPGWDGLEQASQHVRLHVLASRTPRWQRWDWTRSQPGAWQAVPSGNPLVVEGSGVLSRANRALASFAIWVELDDAERRRRALERDGETYAPHWDRWAAQEAAFVEREHPAELADAVVRSAPWSLA